MTLGLSPAALMLAYFDWISHLQTAPAKQAELVQKAVRKATRLWLYACRCPGGDSQGSCEPCIEPLSQDKRFKDPAWKAWPPGLPLRSADFQLCQTTYT